MILASFGVEATLPTTTCSHVLHMYKTATLQVYTTNYYRTAVLRWCRDVAYHCARASE